MDRIKRKKAFIGAAIGAVAGIASSLISANAQKKAARRQARQEALNRTMEEAASLSAKYMDNDSEDELNERIIFKYGGKRNDRLNHAKKFACGGKNCK